VLRFDTLMDAALIVLGGVDDAPASIAGSLC
jgi:hypothetical protein